MRLWQRLGKFKAPGTLLLAAVFAIATISPGGAFSSSASEGSAPDAFGHSFEAFVAALADDAVINEGPAADAASGSSSASATVDADEATPDSDASVEAQVEPQSVVEQVDDYMADVQDVQVDTPPADLSDITDQAAAQEAALEVADAEDVIAALLALLNGAEPRVLAAIDTAEAAVLAKIDQAKADAIAGFAQIDAGELEAFVLSQLDFARVSVQGAFDQVRAMVVQAFAQARTSVVEELTGVDFGDGADEVLAKIAEIQLFVSNALAGVEAILANLGSGL